MAYDSWGNPIYQGAAVPSGWQQNYQDLGQVDGPPDHYWSPTSTVLGHAFGTTPSLPMGYTRGDFNDERAMMARQYLHGGAAAAGSIAASAGLTWGIFGSPVGQLAEKINRSMVRLAGTAFPPAPIFGPAGSGVVRSAGHNLIAGMGQAAKSVGRFTTGVFDSVFSGTTMNTVAFEGGKVVTGTAVTGGLLRMMGRGMGTAMGGTAGAVGGGIASLGGSALRGAASFLAPELTKDIGAGLAARGAALASWGAEAGAAAQAGSWSAKFAGAAEGIGNFMRAPGATTVGGMARAGAGVGAAIGGFALPFAAQMYLTHKAFGWAEGAYDRYKDSAQFERDMFEKSDRILRAGDLDSGGRAGFTEAQRARVLSMAKSMADVEARKSDTFGFGGWSPFGGMTGYNRKMKEVGDVFNVSTDMGMNDNLKSFEDFQKKFSKLVEVTDKLAGVLKTSKAQVLQLVKTMQNLGVEELDQAVNVLERVKLNEGVTGKPREKQIQEMQMGAQQYAARGMDPKVGVGETQRVSRYVSTAIKNGRIAPSEVKIYQGEENIVASMVGLTGDIFQQDPAMSVEISRYLKQDAQGNITFDTKAFEENIADPTNKAKAATQRAERARLLDTKVKDPVTGQMVPYLEGKQRLLQTAWARGIITEDVAHRSMRAVFKQAVTEDPELEGVSSHELFARVARQRGMPETLALAYADYMDGAYQEQFNLENAAEITRQERAKEDEVRPGWKGKIFSQLAGAAAYFFNPIAVLTHWGSGDDYVREKAADAYADWMTGESSGKAYEEYKRGYLRSITGDSRVEMSRRQTSTQKLRASLVPIREFSENIPFRKAVETLETTIRRSNQDMDDALARGADKKSELYQKMYAGYDRFVGTELPAFHRWLEGEERAEDTLVSFTVAAQQGKDLTPEQLGVVGRVRHGLRGRQVVFTQEEQKTAMEVVGAAHAAAVARAQAANKPDRIIQYNKQLQTFIESSGMKVEVAGEQRAFTRSEANAVLREAGYYTSGAARADELRKSLFPDRTSAAASAAYMGVRPGVNPAVEIAQEGYLGAMREAFTGQSYPFVIPATTKENMESMKRLSVDSATKLATLFSRRGLEALAGTTGTKFSVDGREMDYTGFVSQIEREGASPEVIRSVASLLHPSVTTETYVDGSGMTRTRENMNPHEVRKNAIAALLADKNRSSALDRMGASGRELVEYRVLMDRGMYLDNARTMIRKMMPAAGEVTATENVGAERFFKAYSEFLDDKSMSGPDAEKNRRAALKELMASARETRVSTWKGTRRLTAGTVSDIAEVADITKETAAASGITELTRYAQKYAFADDESLPEVMKLAKAAGVAEEDMKDKNAQQLLEMLSQKGAVKNLEEFQLALADLMARTTPARYSQLSPAGMDKVLQEQKYQEGTAPSSTEAMDKLAAITNDKIVLLHDAALILRKVVDELPSRR